MHRFAPHNNPFAVVVIVAAALLGAVGVARAADGPTVEPLAGSPHFGDLSGVELVDEVVAVAEAPGGNGYWMAASDGGVFAFGEAPFHGSIGGFVLDEPVVGMASTPDGDGYWLVATDGGVFAFGDAPFHGSMGGVELAEPVVGMAAAPDGDGYWLVASDGGIFAFGSAQFHGSAGAIDLDEPIVAMTAAPGGSGYWMVARDGGVFSFGPSAQFHGSAVNPERTLDAVSIGADGSGGYWVVTGDSQVHSFGPVETTPSSDAVCRFESVIGATVSSTGSWLLTAPIEVPQPGYTSSATGIDGASIAEQLSYVQACDEIGEVPDMIPPVVGPTSSRFGMRNHPIWGIPILHAGTDIAAPTGTTVRAPAAGTVVALDSRSAYGTTVVLDHGGRIATVFAHLASTSVEIGDNVEAADALGTVGSTGFVTGAHLHVELRVNGEPINPAPHMGL